MIAKFLHSLLHSWPKVLLLFLVLLFVGYPFSAVWHEDIDRTADYNFDNLTKEQSEGVEMMAFLIDREVNQNLWVANLPAFFPLAYLDNMLNFQKGMMRALAEVAKTLPKQIECFQQRDIQSLSNIADLLAYPADVWIFANGDDLKIAPSSSRQYRKALKRLRRLNDDLGKKECLKYGNGESLSVLLTEVDKGLGESIKNLDECFEAESNSWFDTKVDDIFYFNLGKIYAYALILRKFGADYKDVLENNNLEKKWMVLLENMRQAFEIAPKIVVNANLSDATKANHLAYLGYYFAKVRYMLMEIRERLGSVYLDEN